MSYIGQGLPADSFQGFVTDSFTGDGSATTFTLSKEPFSEDTLIVVINNVIQKPTTNFTVSGTTLTIVGTAVASGDVIYAIHMGGPLPIGGAAELDLNGASDKLILDTDGDTTISADTDDQIDFKAGGTDIMSLTATTATFNDGTTITTADNTDTLTLTSTDADANSGPNLRMYRNSGSPADDDFLGEVQFEGRNDNSEDVIYGQILTRIRDASDGTEDAQLTLKTMVAGTAQNRLEFNESEAVFNDDSIDVDFRVEGDGNTHALFVRASDDHVGINEDAPDCRFHIKETNDTSFSIDNFTNIDNSILKLENASTTNDAFVNMSFRTGDGMDLFFGGVQDSSDGNKGSFVFGRQDSTDVELLRINGNGNMSIGTSVELGRLHLRMPTTAGTDPVIHFSDANGDDCGSIDLNASANTVAYTTSSDYRLKENVNYSWDATTELKKLKPAKFNFKADADTTVEGFLAHEVSDIVPIAVTGEKDELEVWEADEKLPDGVSVGDNKLDDSGNTIPKYQGIDQSKLVPLMVKTIQELEARIKTLEDA